MSYLQRQRGFSAVEVVIAILVVAGIGVTGYLAYDRMQETTKSPSPSDQADKGVAPPAPEIGDTKDLDDATKALDDTNLDAGTSDTTALDTELRNF